MIGVVAAQSDLAWVAEFFELFKTPWELATPGRRYRVLLSTTDVTDDHRADLWLAYGAAELSLDRRFGLRAERLIGADTIDWNGQTLPLYADAARFSGDLDPDALRCGPHACSYRRSCGHATIRRFGYDLFAEVRHLLTHGQPKSRAAFPTLEFHIELQRTCLQEAGVPYVEIPPRPHGHSFVCCLTHDVDFFGVRRHRGDSTLAGFFLRATAGTVIDVLRGRRRFDDAARNFAAALSLPFVFLGLKRDFWHPFDDYARVEGSRASTFFLIPFKARPGIAPDGKLRRRRSAPYGAGDIKAEVAKKRVTSPTEFGVHGIDAWRDAAAGAAELREVEAATGENGSGVRMHWLYFSADSAKKLEDAGFAYDSTYGFNDAVGYRAGTAQVFRLPGCQQLLELPMAIMDTAMFYIDRMGLHPRQALERCRAIVRDMQRFGGALVINWHDRSLAPERLWGRSYRELLSDLDAADVWFATARDSVEWFKWRRSIRFTVDEAFDRVEVTAPEPRAGLPAGSIQIHWNRPDERSDEMHFAGNPLTVTL